jgi:hypothetical protein
MPTNNLFRSRRASLLERPDHVLDPAEHRRALAALGAEQERFYAPFLRVSVKNHFVMLTFLMYPFAQIAFLSGL